MSDEITKALRLKLPGKMPDASSRHDIFDEKTPQ